MGVAFNSAAGIKICDLSPFQCDSFVYVWLESKTVIVMR